MFIKYLLSSILFFTGSVSLLAMVTNTRMIMSVEPARITSVEVDGGQFNAVFECRHKDLIVANINSFNEVYGSSKRCDQEHVVQDESGQCQLSLNSCLPKNLAEKLGGTYPVSGPNCYGTSLYTTNNYKYVRFVSVKEFDTIVSSRFCEKREAPGPSVIGYFSTNLESVHAFTYVTKNLSFERLGFDLKGDIYPFIANYVPNTIYKWEADEYCRRYATPAKECYNKLNYVSCDLSSLFSMLPGPVKSKLDKIESSVNTLLLNESKDPFALLVETRAEVEALRELIGRSVIEGESKAILYEMINSFKDQLGSVERHINNYVTSV